MNSQAKILFHYTAGPFSFRDRSKLKLYLEALVKDEKRVLEAVNIVFCDDAYLIQLNREYLAHDTYTDIITFELSGPGEPIISDVFISVERVRANAKELTIPFKQELHRVIFHGFLHLCGYKDKTAKDRETMRRMEAHHLRSYFVPRGTTKSF